MGSLSVRAREGATRSAKTSTMHNKMERIVGFKTLGDLGKREQSKEQSESPRARLWRTNCPKKDETAPLLGRPEMRLILLAFILLFDRSSMY